MHPLDILFCTGMAILLGLAIAHNFFGLNLI